MLLASAVHISLGWAWHTIHRARLHWSWKREGALVAAATIALIGAVDTARTLGSDRTTAPVSRPAAALTAMSTPVVTETTPLEILPAAEIATVAAVPSPGPDPAPKVDLIAGKILERLGDDAPTASIPDAPKHKPVKGTPARKHKPAQQDGTPD